MGYMPVCGKTGFGKTGRKHHSPIAKSTLRQALEDLEASPSEQQRLADAALEAAQTDFNPDRIQR
jgi:hypothetical protein